MEVGGPLEDTAPVECEPEPLPAPRSGDVYTYDALGRARFSLTTDGLVTDWSATDPEAQEKGPLVLPKESRLGIALASATAPRLLGNGALGQAWQATFWASHPEHASPLAFMDEWFDPLTGRLSQVTVRAGTNVSGEFSHLVRMGMEEVPGLLLAPLTWERVLAPDHTVVHHHFPRYVTVPDPQPSTNLTLEWTTTNDEDGRCLIHLHAATEVTTGPIRVPFEVNATYEPGIPLPTRYEEVYPTFDAGMGLTLDLIHHRGGRGIALAPFVQGPTSSQSGANLTTVPVVHGFMLDDVPVFPTRLSEALEAIRADEVAGAWLERNPDARPSRVLHIMGEPGSDIADRWDIHWATPGGDAQSAQATNRSVKGLLPRIVVGSSPSSESVPVPPFERMVPLSALAHMHLATYGSPAEVLSCQLTAYRTCFIGTHDGTHYPRACEAACGGLSILPGLVVWMEGGRVSSEQSYDPNAIAPAVRVPVGWPENTGSS